MEKSPMQIKRFLWNSNIGEFTPAGDASAEDQLSISQNRIISRIPFSARQFLKGPVPWDWIISAAALPGKALVVGICLWRLAGVKKTKTVMLASDELKPFGLNGATKSRAISALEKAGLIAVLHKRGRFPIISLLDAEVPVERTRH